MTSLSRRLETVVQLVRPCALLADVGTDHGLVPVTVVQRGVAQRAIAADLRAAPLRGAQNYITRCGVADRVTVVQGDGLLPLDAQRVDVVVLAGMSGSLMVRLWEAAPQVLNTLQQLIVQPNKDVPRVRAWARHHGWHLHDERMVEERGRFFTVCAFVKGSAEDPAYAVAGWTPEALGNVGPLLLSRQDPVARKWYAAQRKRLLYWVEKGVQTLTPELRRWQKACDFVR